MKLARISLTQKQNIDLVEKTKGNYNFRTWTEGNLTFATYNREVMERSRRTGETRTITTYNIRIWRGKQSNPFIAYYYRDEINRQHTIDEQTRREEERQEELKARRAARNKAHDWEVGQIVYSSWGYDQTNVDFYEVIKRTKRTVTIRAIASETVHAGKGSDSVAAVKGKFTSDEELTRVVNGKSIKLEGNFMFGWKWDGSPKHQTPFGEGH